MRLHKDIWWLLGSTVAAVCLAPLLVHGDAEVTARRTAAASQIEQLAPAQRQELDENLKRFEKLSPKEQESFGSLHERVRQNAPVGEALEAFAHWWPTVSAREQAEIFGVKDNPAKRLELVRDVQKDIESDRLERLFVGRHIPKEGRPTTEDFYRVMDAIEAIAGDSLDLSAADQEELDRFPKHTAQRTLALLTTFRKKDKDFSTIVQGDARKARLVEAISSKPFQDYIRQQFKDIRFGDGTFMVRAVLSMKMWHELFQEGILQPIGDNELLAELNKLPSEQLELMYSNSADEQREILRRMIVAEKMGAVSPINEFFQMFRWRGGPFDRGGNDPRRGRGDGRDGSRNEGSRGDGTRSSNPDNKP